LGGGARFRVGHELIDDFLEFPSARDRPNTLRCDAHDLKALFAVVDKEVVEVTLADVLALCRRSSVFVLEAARPAKTLRRVTSKP